VLNKEAVISRAGKALTGALSRVIPNKPEQPKVQLLTPRQQVDRFISMSDQQLQRIKVAKGDFEYARYLNAMTQLSKDIYGGSNGGI
jgi:hypothetical protein